MSPSFWFTTEDGEDGFEEALRPPQVVKVNISLQLFCPLGS